MKPEFAKIEITNRKNYNEAYHIVLNDPDHGFLANDELIVVNDLFLRTIDSTSWWRYLCTLGIINPQTISFVDDSNCLELMPGQTGSILLYYYS